jgi:hypothetical protein
MIIALPSPSGFNDGVARPHLEPIDPSDFLIPGQIRKVQI